MSVRIVVPGRSLIVELDDGAAFAAAVANWLVGQPGITDQASFNSTIDAMGAGALDAATKVFFKALVKLTVGT